MYNFNLHIEQIIEIIKFVQSTEKDVSYQICDNRFCFGFVGEKLANQFGYTTEEILGKHLCELDTPVKHLSPEYLKIHTSLPLQPQASINYLTIIPELNHMIIQNQVTPIINNNSFAGLYIKSSEINSLQSFLPLKEVLGNCVNKAARIIRLTKHPSHKNLTEKEELVLYLIVLGKFDKEIAEILSKIYQSGISRDAITKCVTRRLYAEFDVVNRSELIIEAYKAEIWNHIPKLLIQFNKFL